MIDDVRKRFDAEITAIFREKENIRNFILKHERKNLCLENLCEQIRNCERHTYSLTFDVKIYSQLIRDYAKIFAKVALEKIEQDHYSQARKTAIAAQQDIIKNAEQTLIDLEKEVFRETDEIEKADLLKRKHNEQLVADAAKRELDRTSN